MEDYSKKDFASTYEDLLSMVKSSTNLWSPSNSTEADPGVVVLKLMAFLEDRAGYRFDMAHAQNYLDSVSDRQTAQELLQMLGYTMRHARAATGEVRFQVIDMSQYAEGFVVPIFTKLTDRTKSIKFFTTTQLSINSENIDKLLAAEVQAGEPFQVVKDGVAYYTLKDVDEQGRLYLGKSNLAQNGIYVFSDSNITGDSLQARASHKWTYVDFSILKPRGNFYTVGEGENGEMYVQFPDNFEDLLTGQYIEVWATYTEGAASNIAANTLALFDDSTDFTGKDNLTIAQPNDIYTGQDAESIDEASKHYYETKDICNTLVTAQDFATAIRYLINGNTDEIGGTLPGQRFFSNAIVRTAQSRRLPVRTKAYDKEYTLFEKVDGQTPCNQLDVVGLQYSSSYPESFKVRPIDTGIESEFERQLQDNHVLDVELVDGQTTAGTIDRILAVATPSMIIRISRNATITDLALKQKIRDYFYSKYRADNIEFGKPLDYQTIVDDIRALDPSINSVSMEELSYDLFKKYSQVDGGQSVPLSDDDKKEAVAKSALAGIIPLYRFYNRQNTPSKENVFYSMSSTTQSSDTQTAAESVVSIPFCSTDYAKIESTQPVIKDIKFCQNLFCFSYMGNASYSKNGNLTYIIPMISRNQLLQFRRPLTQDKTTYGYGMQYVFTRYHLIGDTAKTATADSVLGDGTVLTKGSKLVTDRTIPANLSSYFDETKTVTANSVILKGSYDVKEGTVLAKGSKLAPNSKFIVSATETIEYAPDDVPQDTPYVLRKGENLRILTSKGEEKENLGAGNYVKTTGFTLVPKPDTATLTALSTVETISTQEEQTSDIGIEFKYLLSLKHQVENNTLDISSGYMLEEGEFFIYADKAISEYVILGAGTVLKPAKENAQVTLIASYLTAVDEVTKDSGFKDVPAPIKGVVYEFQNFRYPCCAVFDNEEDSGYVTGEGISLSNGWAELKGDCLIRHSSLFTDEMTDHEVWAKVGTLQSFMESVTGGSSGLSTEKEDDIVMKAADKWECRRALLLETDEENVCFITYACSLVLQDTHKDIDINKVRVGDDSTDISGFISASSSFSTTVATTGEIELLPTGVTMQFGCGSYKEPMLSWGEDFAIRVNSTRSLSFICSANGTPGATFVVAVPGAKTSQSEATEEAGKIEKILFYVSTVGQYKSGTITFTAKSAVGEAPMIIRSYLTGTAVFDCANTNQRYGDVFEIQLQEAATNRTDVRLNFTLSGFDVSEASKLEIVLSELSYVTGPATETGLTDGTAADIESAIRTEYDSGRFNWLYTPTEDFVDPTSADSFFNELHPYNYCTIPYINFDAASIKIIRER